MNAPELLKAEILLFRRIEARVLAYGYIKGTREYRSALDTELAFYRRFVVFTDLTSDK